MGVPGMLAETPPETFGFPKQLGGGQQQRDRRARGMGWGYRQGVACDQSPTATPAMTLMLQCIHDAGAYRLCCANCAPSKCRNPVLCSATNTPKDGANSPMILETQIVPL